MMSVWYIMESYTTENDNVGGLLPFTWKARIWMDHYTTWV